MPTRAAKLYFIKIPLGSYNDARRVPLIIYKDPPPPVKDWSHMLFTRNPSDENNVHHRSVHCTTDGASEMIFKTNLWPKLQLAASTSLVSYGNAEVHERFFRQEDCLVEECLSAYRPVGSYPTRGFRTYYKPNPDSWKTGKYSLIEEEFVEEMNNSWNFSGYQVANTRRSTGYLRNLEYWGDVTVSFLEPAQLNCPMIFDSLDAKHAIPSGTKSQAFRNATDNLRLTTGNVANIADLLSIATGLVTQGPFGAVLNVKKEVRALQLGARLAPSILKEIRRHAPKMAARALLKNQWAKKLADSWLWYRYAYTTTCSDLEEIHKKCKSLRITEQGWHTVRSAMSLPQGQFHCKASIWKRNSDPASELALRLYEYGLQVDPYVIWDLVPLSFVVDWFTDIGSRLEDKSSDWLKTSAVFDIPSITYSWKYRETLQIGFAAFEFTSYTRWEESESPTFEYYKEDTSLKTVIYRVLDGSALTLTAIRHRL